MQLLVLAAAAQGLAAQGLHGLHGLAATGRAAHGLHGLAAAHGLHGLAAAHGFFAAHGLHGFFAAHGLHGPHWALASPATMADALLIAATPAIPAPSATATGIIVEASILFLKGVIVSSLFWRRQAGKMRARPQRAAHPARGDGRRSSWSP